LFFVNPDSGSGLAAELIRMVEPLPGISIVRLPTEADTWSLGHEDIIRHPRLRLVACGGDGTVNWVVSLMNAFFGPDNLDARPPIAVIPFGTGNDMSRALGWGGGMDSNSIRNIASRLDAIRKSRQIQEIDVWKILLTTLEASTSKTHQMLSYFSIGVDAEMALDFEAVRKGRCGKCICCHCMSLACYCPVGVRNALFKRSISSYCQIDVDEVTPAGTHIHRRLAPTSSDKTLIFQAIPFMYAGRDPWCSPIPRSMSDQKVELTFQGGSASLGWLQIGVNLSRPCCQVSRASIKTTEPFHMQIDGEGTFVNGPANIQFSRSGSYPVIFNSSGMGKVDHA
jgi:diacylglycerol kinase (ATP)